MQHYKLTNDGTKAIQLMQQFLADDRFHDYLKNAFPNRFWKPDPDLFSGAEEHATAELGSLESGLKNLRKFIAVENKPLVVFD